MKIGILSDTHDNITNINRALDWLKNKGINFFIHAGDYIAPFSLRPYFDKGFDFIGVFGNNDGEKEGLGKISKGKIFPPPYLFNLYQRDILVVHDLSQAKPHIFNISVVIFGHTHKPQTFREGKTLFINPGETCGWLTGKATIGILDLEKIEAEIIELN
ncbi:MAG: metallophosphoesterase [Candidatus Omnitrophica bacterium]|nr:metallophosphoesterase [Candidatus Omnitrophota bacterium]MCM8826182.1 metallophosphoesterase [Candidatus Omnitrophota bacterium]